MDKLKTISIKGKQYVTVNERVKAFREHFSEYSLETELVAVNADTALVRAVIRTPDGRVIATGTAFERKDDAMSLVNKTSHVENCETSAWGRALANLGIGIDESIASAQEVANAIATQEKPSYSNVPTPPKTTKPPRPQMVKVLEELKKCQAREPLDQLFSRAMEHEWTDAQTTTIRNCYLNCSEKFPPKDLGAEMMPSDISAS